MKHLTEEELIERYCAGNLRTRGFLKTEAELHLQACNQCTKAYQEIVRMLGAVHGPEPPARPAEYGAQVWQSIQGQLPQYRTKRKWSEVFWPSFAPKFAYAAAALLLLAGTFFAGKYWERKYAHPEQAEAPPQQVKERVVLFVLDGHLDRSERLLVQLNHAGDGAGAAEEAVDLPLQSEARQLLADNRLYRGSVSQSKDPLLANALDHLERVLLEVSNSPDKLDSEEIARIEKELNTDGLLFQIRVLRARVSGREAETKSDTTKGRTI